jgi:hypothetical protein
MEIPEGVHGWRWYDLDASLLTWVQAWYASNCDNDWEHSFGLSLTTLDNPGWHLAIDVTSTPMGGVPYAPVTAQRDPHDWITTELVDKGSQPGVTGTSWQAHCGPLNLGEALHLFREWVRSHTLPSEAAD